MMKKLFFLAVLFSTVIASQAQGLNPVSWSYSAKKIADKTYELYLTATIQDGWHVFSQVQPKDDAIADPTVITFNNNPTVTPDGRIREEGKLEKFRDNKLKVSANQYSKKVDFVQVVKLKADIKTNVTGEVYYQTCNDEKCLPGKKVKFTIPIQ